MVLKAEALRIARRDAGEPQHIKFSVPADSAPTAQSSEVTEADLQAYADGYDWD